MNLTEAQLRALLEVVAAMDGYYVIMPPPEDGTHAFALRHDRTMRLHEWHEHRHEAWLDAPDYLGDLDAIRALQESWINFGASPYIRAERASMLEARLITILKHQRDTYRATAVEHCVALVMCECPEKWFIISSTPTT